MSLVDAPDESIGCPAGRVLWVRRGPGVRAGHCTAPSSGHRYRARVGAEGDRVRGAGQECAGCGAVGAGELPAHVRAHASYGPESCAGAANLVNGHHIPVHLRDRFRVRNAHANQVTAGAGKQPRPDGMVSPRG
jgi:hypothetical protein